MRTAHLVLGICLSLLVVPAGARAEPLAVRSGKVVLPVTGLAIELPKDKRKTATWVLAGSWALSKGGTSFDGRDVVDQRVGDRLVAGNWIHVGYFDAGACAAVVKELDVVDRWTGEHDLYGEHFQIAGGIFDLGGDLGEVPAVALCAGPADGQRLLLYHFFLEAKPPVGEAALGALAKDRLLDRVARAWRAGATGPAQPTHRPEVNRRGDIAAARTVRLLHSQLEVAVPDDGYVWLVRGDADGDGASDFFDRMAPALPDVTLEVGRIDGHTCDEIFGSVSPAPIVAEPAPVGIPSGWKACPTLALDTGLERVICRDVGTTAVLVGLLATPSDTPAARDFGPFAELLGALAAAAATPAR